MFHELVSPHSITRNIDIGKETNIISNQRPLKISKIQDAVNKNSLYRTTSFKLFLSHLGALNYVLKNLQSF